jgi:hypothetical protein
MKNPSRTIKYALVAVALFTIVGCKKNYAEVKPGSEVSEKGCADIDKILAKYDKSLYRFHKFENGEFVSGSEEGTLSEADMPPGTIKQVADAAKNVKLTGCALQAGRCPKPGTRSWYFSKTSTMAVRIEKMTDLPQLEKVLQNNQKDNR